MSTSHGGPKHPYHLVDPSPWPVIGAACAGLMFGGAVLYMHYTPDHKGPLWLIAPGLIGVLAIMAVWWRDVIKEAVHQGHHTPVVQIGLRYRMALFIASEVMFFAAFFWAFFTSALFPVGGVWPPKGIHPFNPWEIPFLNTLILLTSGTTVTWAHHALLNNDRKGMIQGLLVTVILGVCFTVAHMGNNGESPIGLLLVFTAGLVFSYAVWRTGALWWGIGFHAAWDWMQSFTFGVADSGHPSKDALLLSKPAGPDWLSGGSTGPEGSVLTLAVMAAVAVLIHLTLRKPDEDLGVKW